MSRAVIFKTYDQDHLNLLSPSYDDLFTIVLVVKNHPVRIVNTSIDFLDISVLEKGLIKTNQLTKKQNKTLITSRNIGQACSLRSQCHNSKENRMEERP